MSPTTAMRSKPTMWERLSRAQNDALAHVERNALEMRGRTEARLQQVLETQSVAEADYRDAMARLRSEGRVVLAFHPERLSGSGRTVVDGLLSDGVYRNQFETGLSSGSVSAFAGGRRDEWERRLFGGMYHRRGVGWAQRPKYGALFLLGHPDGPCPRFGSCYFVLRPHVSERSTFTLLGSHADSATEETGTLRVFEPVMTALAEHVEMFPAPFGLAGLTFRRLVAAMCLRLPAVVDAGPADRLGRALDSFVEAQVHGPVDLELDVEALVVDASFTGTATGDAVGQLAATYNISLQWHPGFTLAAEDFPERFRGFPTRPIAHRVAVNGMVNAPNLGSGQSDFIVNPDGWREFGRESEILTSFRRVWHVLVLLGESSPEWQGLAAENRVNWVGGGV